MKKLKISILGSGNGGSSLSANLKAKGHHVTLIKTSNSIHNDHFKSLLDNEGLITYVEGDSIMQVRLDEVSTDLSLIKNSDVIIVFIQTNYHEGLIERMAPYLKDQLILLEPGYLSTAYFMKHLKDKDITVAEAESSPLDCRITNPGEVKVVFKNARNPVGIYPHENKAKAIELLNLLDLSFTYNVSAIEAALHNPNLIVHTIGAIMSIPRIEYSKGNYSMYKEVFTPTVWNIVSALDKEKMNVLEKMGYRPLPYVEACKLRNSEDDNKKAIEVFKDYARNHSTAGPHVPDSRYITEDVPEGLVLLESLGKKLGVETPLCSALITLADSAMEANYRKTGRTLERLGEEFFDKILEDSKKVIEL